MADELWAVYKVVSGSMLPHTRERTFSCHGSVMCVRSWYTESLAGGPLFFRRRVYFISRFL
jgi:hypothetical protein